MTDKFIVFDDHLVHSDVGNWLMRLYRATLVSAGFVSTDRETGQLKCYGKSESLNLASGPTDSILMHRAI